MRPWHRPGRHTLAEPASRWDPAPEMTPERYYREQCRRSPDLAGARQVVEDYRAFDPEPWTTAREWRQQSARGHLALLELVNAIDRCSKDVAEPEREAG
jgi:hypothetical protein